MPMQNFTAVVERCADTGRFVGYVPGFPGAHAQGETLEELNDNLKEVITALLEEPDGPPPAEGSPVKNPQPSFVAMGASSTGRRASEADHLLAEGFGGDNSG
ncbi:MAG: type II toxin-antitoxin system HicB family antitoxin [Acidimicrobiaceae bacterium]|nr:type II toxin-antitoxin system HicB family antitoxin [Acidimicrobiaceae bacterium]